MYVARQRLGKNITTATNTHATIEELWMPCFLRGPCRIKCKLLVFPELLVFIFIITGHRPMMAD
jgi:hypothetical protein